ncbi:MAG TPA: RdgB/HAM1 family non-canonical purine NTP pyrophosphatase [Polyangiaceae bacterium]|nr:RdgB/HAM1 family non-canonical purine NTP pyrophosphatase [Polyangiaceae bacterium]
MEVLFATSNPHKVAEVEAILAPFGIVVRSLADVDRVPEEPEEDGVTFEDNARLKARYYARELGLTCVADDSGIEVDALGGAPGVHSARYSGVPGTRDERDAANNRKLLDALRDVPDGQRQGRFVCVASVADPDGRILAEARGTFDGTIARAPQGTNGFGYDPLLYLADRGCTSAELTPDEKHARSHRGKAFRALSEQLASLQRG